MHKNKNVINSRIEKRNFSDGKDNSSEANTNNSVGPTRRYVSGDEEKSSSSHQFHKS